MPTLPDVFKNWSKLNDNDEGGSSGKDDDKVISVYVMKACDGSWGIAALVLTLSTKGSSVVNYTQRPLYPDVQPRLNRRVCFAPSRSGRFGEERNSVSMPGIK
jgi:hypothetical protein